MTLGPRVRRWIPLGIPVVVFVLLCLGGVTTSSLGALQQDPRVPVAHQIGTPETVRSDEFITETPIELGWITAGGRGTTDPLSVPPNFFAQLPSGPVSSIVFFDGTITRLGPWLPDAMLFAGKWWLPTLLLVLGLPTWFKQVTGSRRWGWVATALIFFAPANQWWSGRPVNTLGFMFAGAALMIDAQSRWSAGRRALALGEIAVAAVLIARFPSYYQPFAIILGFPVLIGTALFLLRQQAPWAAKAWAIAGTGVASAVLTAATMLESLPAIRAGLGTVYPGRRVSTGTAMSFGKVFGAPVLGTLQHLQKAMVNNNATETSSAFVVLLLVALLLRATTHWRGGPGTQLQWWSWVAITGVWLSWCLVDYGQLGSHLPLLNLVPAIRAANVVGFLATVAFCLLMAQLHKPGIARGLAAGALAGAITALAGQSWQGNGLPGLTTTVVVVSSLVAAVVVAPAVVWPGHWLPLAAMGVAAALVTIQVNPIVAGLGDLRGSATARAMIAAGSKARAKHQLWASDSPTVDALLFATGTPALSERQQIGPNDREWLKLDPGGAHKDVWNRGGTFVRFTWSDSDTIQWSNPTIDQIVMTVSPCAVARLEPRLTHIVSTQPLTLPCLRPDPRKLVWEGGRQWVYRVRA